MNRPTSKKVLGWFGLSLAVPLATLFMTSGIMSIPPNTRGIDIVAGQELFSVHCGSCHFANLGPPAHHGPNLHDIGKKGALRRPNQTAARYILESILDPNAFVSPSGQPGMPPNIAAELAPEEIRNLIGFMASCGAFPDYDEIKNLEIPDRRSEKTETVLIRLEDMQLAENVLREKGECLKCHSFFKSPEGSSFAPGIFGLGLNNKKSLHESLVEPDKDIKPQYESVKVLLENGEFLLGKLVSLTDEQLVLCIRDEQNQLVMRNIPLTDVEEEDGQPLIKVSKTSLMPTGFDKSLTKEEIDAVINLIRQLN
jgi:putative heme-binding domain-containing protein